MTAVFIFEDENRADTSRRMIDDEIITLENKIRALKSRRNMLSRMSQLPPELLARIFHFTVTATDFGCNSPLDRLKVATHICSHWRTVALNSPTLWANISFTHPEWALEMLRRSKMASLALLVDVPTRASPGLENALKAALTAISRTRILHIATSSPLVDELMSQTMDAPILECLSVGQLDENNEQTVIPDQFLNKGTPHLRHLALLNCRFRWDSSFFRDITHLTIINVESSRRPTTDRMIAIFENTPLLESLDLKDALPVFPEDAVTVDAPRCVINLSYLAHLSITSNVLECANLFNHISFPGSARLKLAVMGTEKTQYDFSTILASLSNFISSRTEPIHNFEIHPCMMRGRKVYFQGWSGIEPDDQFRIPSAPPLDFSFDWLQYGPPRMEATITALCGLLPLSQLRSLRLSFMGEVGASCWKSNFGDLPLLQSISYRAHDPQALVPSLTPANLDSADVPFPGLRHLALHDVVFEDDDDDNSGDEEDVEGHDEDGGIKFNRFINCLIHRRNQNAELRKLTLSHCLNLDADGVKVLEGVIADVVWDGFVDMVHDDDSEEELMVGSPYNYGSIFDIMPVVQFG